MQQNMQEVPVIKMQSTFEDFIKLLNNHKLKLLDKRAALQRVKKITNNRLTFSTDI